jgi:hypothetical protein
MRAALLKRCVGSLPVLNDEEIPTAIELAYDLLDLFGTALRQWEQDLLPRFRSQLQHQGSLRIGILRRDHNGTSASNDAG